MNSLHRTPRSAVAALAALVALTLLACHSFHTETPTGFVELKDPGNYDYRATTADGVVLAVRVLHDQPKGELTFWTTAIERQMRERGGYAILQTKDVKTREGRTGKQLHFGHDEGKTPHLYTITLFLDGTTLYLLEAGGPKDLMEKRARDLESAIDHFRAG